MWERRTKLLYWAIRRFTPTLLVIQTSSILFLLPASILTFIFPHLFYPWNGFQLYHYITHVITVWFFCWWKTNGLIFQVWGFYGRLLRTRYDLNVSQSRVWMDGVTIDLWLIFSSHSFWLAHNKSKLCQPTVGSYRFWYRYRYVPSAVRNNHQSPNNKF